MYICVITVDVGEYLCIYVCNYCGCGEYLCIYV